MWQVFVGILVYVLTITPQVVDHYTYKSTLLETLPQSGTSADIQVSVRQIMQKFIVSHW